MTENTAVPQCVYVSIQDVKSNPDNPRIIKDDKFKKLVKSIQEFPKMLSLRPIVVNDDMMVLGGNMRLKACTEAGLTEVPIIRASDLSEEEQKEFIIKDNVGFGEWDFEVLRNQWDTQELAQWGVDVPFMKPADMEDAFDEMRAEANEPERIDIEIGDLIEIGPHRLVCGDSTHSDVVDKLLNGAKPFLMVTDTPYGVEYDPAWRNEIDGGTEGAGAMGAVLNDDRADWSEAWSLSPASVAYVYHAGKYSGVVQKSLEDNDYVTRSQIIWFKSHFAFGRSDYHWQHEPCWYMVKKDANANWISDRKQTTVWEIGKNASNETGHSTQKPVECMTTPIANHSGDVYDPFLGSGTTMVAAHQLKRKCYGVELNPKYCQIIIDRMLDLDHTLHVKINGKDYEK